MCTFAKQICYNNWQWLQWPWDLKGPGGVWGLGAVCWFAWLDFSSTLRCCCKNMDRSRWEMSYFFSFWKCYRILFHFIFRKDGHKVIVGVFSKMSALRKLLPAEGCWKWRELRRNNQGRRLRVWCLRSLIINSTFALTENTGKRCADT